MVILSIGAATLAGKGYLMVRDANTVLEHRIELNNQARLHREAMEASLGALRAEYDALQRTTETNHMEALNAISLQLLSAQRDAVQTPIAFGDTLIRDFIRVDCMWSLGERATDPASRQACSDEAANADPARSGLPFAALTPTFLRGWGDACYDWEHSVTSGDGDLDYTEADWQLEYGNFDVALCRETIVAMTPEASLLFRRFLENGLSYTTQLVNYAVEQNKVISQLSQ